MENALNLQTYKVKDPNTFEEGNEQNNMHQLLAQFFLQDEKMKKDTLSSQVEVYPDTTTGAKLIGFQGTIQVEVYPDTTIGAKLIGLQGTIPWINLAYKNLDEVYKECSEASWDGYGASPVTYTTYLETRKLLTMLPFSFPMPEICPEPNGGFGLEWYKERGYSLIVSVSGRNIITYAGLFGKNNEAHGAEDFNNSVPQVILNCLNRLFPNTE